MEYVPLESVTYIVRILGRFGLVFLLTGFYRLYKVFASPSLKSRSKFFIYTFTWILIISFILLIAEPFLQWPWFSIITTSFNVLSVFFLAGYVAHHVKMMEARKDSAEFRKYALAMDLYLESLKHPQRDDDK